MSNRKSPGLCTIKVKNKENQIKNRSLFFSLDGREWMLPWLHSSVLIKATQASLPSCETKSIFHPEDMAYGLRGHWVPKGQKPRDCLRPVFTATCRSFSGNGQVEQKDEQGDELLSCLRPVHVQTLSPCNRSTRKRTMNEWMYLYRHKQRWMAEQRTWSASG